MMALNASCRDLTKQDGIARMAAKRYPRRWQFNGEYRRCSHQANDSEAALATASFDV